MRPKLLLSHHFHDSERIIDIGCKATEIHTGHRLCTYLGEKNHFDGMAFRDESAISSQFRSAFCTMKCSIIRVAVICCINALAFASSFLHFSLLFSCDFLPPFSLLLPRDCDGNHIHRSAHTFTRRCHQTFILNRI